MERNEKDNTGEDLQEAKDIIFDEDREDSVEIENGTGQIRSISFSKLIEIVTSKNAVDQNLVTTMFLTYRGFQSPKMLLLALIKRFLTAPEEDRAVIQLRVLSIIGMWINKYWSDFNKDRQTLLPILQRFLDKCSKGDQISTKAPTAVIDTILSRLASQMKLDSKPDLFKVANDAPSLQCSMIEAANPIELLDWIQPKELAEQLTIYEWGFWSKIQPCELLNLAWTKAKRQELAPNVTKLISIFNTTCLWVPMSILTTEDLAARIKRVEYWIWTAQHLLALNNLNGAMAVVAGLNRSDVFRLTITHEGVNDQCKEILKMLQELMNGAKSYASLRQHMQNMTHHCIPYLGMYLTDLVFAWESGPDHSGSSLIRWKKYEVTAGIIQNMLLFQQIPYQLTSTFDIQQKIESFVFFDDGELWQCSNYLQPRAGQIIARPYCLEKFLEDLKKKKQDE